MTTPVTPPRRRQKGKAVKWSERDMDLMAIVTPDYIDTARAVWERDARPADKGLPDTRETLEGKP